MAKQGIQNEQVNKNLGLLGTICESPPPKPQQTIKSAQKTGQNKQREKRSPK